MCKLYEKQNSSVELVKTDTGYYTVRQKPSPQELKEYYSNKYYQDGKGEYAQKYSEEEFLYFENKCRQNEKILTWLFDELKNRKIHRRFLDVGCGEGWSLSYFLKQKYEVRGFDHSDFGIKLHNPHCLSYFEQGDMFELLDNEINTSNKYDTVYLDNVLEHVIDPESLLVKLNNIVAGKGVLCVEVPNDFSQTQNELRRKNIVANEYWVNLPSHLSYFNTESLKLVAEKCGWECRKMVSDYPIDFHLFNNQTNYIKNKSVGNGCHQNRVRVVNFLAGLDHEKKIRLFELLAEMGVGRTITAFLTKKK